MHGFEFISCFTLKDRFSLYISVNFSRVHFLVTCVSNVWLESPVLKCPPVLACCLCLSQVVLLFNFEGSLSALSALWPKPCSSIRVTKADIKWLREKQVPKKYLESTSTDVVQLTSEEYLLRTKFSIVMQNHETLLNVPFNRLLCQGYIIILLLWWRCTQALEHLEHHGNH